MGQLEVSPKEEIHHHHYFLLKEPSKHQLPVAYPHAADCPIRLSIESK